MADISPQLYEAIKTEFEKKVAGNSAIKYVLDGINSGEFASTRYGYQYSELIGTALASAFQNVLSSDVLPDGKMYYNIAKSVVEPFLRDNYEATAAVATRIEQTLFDKAGIGLKPITPKVNQDKIDGIINRLDSEPDFDKVKWILNEPVVNFTQSAMDDSIQQNVNFQGRAGRTPVVTRIVARKCCEWCEGLAGKYSYPNVPQDVYRRHENCRCMVEYNPGDGTRQNVWSKETYSVEESQQRWTDFIKEREGLFRKTHNTGAFSSLKEPMQKRHIENLIKEVDDVDYRGVKIHIERNEDAIGSGYAGLTDKDANYVIFFPDAFKDRETLVKTIAHEGTHLDQIRKEGYTEDSIKLARREAEAYAKENEIWYKYKKKTGYNED